MSWHATNNSTLWRRAAVPVVGRVWIQPRNFFLIAKVVRSGHWLSQSQVWKLCAHIPSEDPGNLDLDAVSLYTWVGGGPLSVLVLGEECGLWLHCFLASHAGAGCLAMEPQLHPPHRETEPRTHLTAFGGRSEVKGLPSAVPGVGKVSGRFTLILV